MPVGPGKYDDLCTLVRDRVGLGGDNLKIGSGVMVIVLNGDKGNGFAVQADALGTLMIPELLEMVLQQLRPPGGKQ